MALLRIDREVCIYITCLDWLPIAPSKLFISIRSVSRIYQIGCIRSLSHKLFTSTGYTSPPFQTAHHAIIFDCGLHYTMHVSGKSLRCSYRTEERLWGCRQIHLLRGPDGFWADEGEIRGPLHLDSGQRHHRTLGKHFLPCIHRTILTVL